MKVNVSAEQNVTVQDAASTDTVELEHDPDASTPLPRPERCRRRSKADRGLPDDAELARLAETYLEHQNRLFRNTASCGALPLANSETIQAMVDDFKRRHRGGGVDREQVKARLLLLHLTKPAGAYLRYSCDNSNPTSIVDQLVKCLEKSASEGNFIPWEYIFADYSVTGLDAARQGYTSYKSVLSDENQLVETTYIDDFTRASRDEIEWWKLAAISKRLKKRMIGAGDGFDLQSSDWDLKVTIYGLVSRLFIKSLRQKVSRGMQGAAQRGTCLGKLPLGYTRQPRRDAHGNVMLKANGFPLHEPSIDAETSPFRRLMYELYVEQNWSIPKIAKHFSQLKVDGWDGWTTTAVKKLLWSPTALGIFTWNKTRREFDYEEMKWVTKMNPVSEWIVLIRRDLAVVPLALWKAARRKIAARRRNHPQTGKRPTRNQVSPTTLFSGTLYCDCCENNELKLIRSTQNFKQLGSVHGVAGAHRCQLSTSKSVRVIEECLLGYLKNQLLTPEVIEELVVQANAWLDQEAAKPLPETAPLQKRVGDLQKKIQRLVKRSAETDDEGVAARYEEEIKQLQRQFKIEQKALNDALVAQRRTIQRLDVESATQLLTNLRENLQQNVAVAGVLIRELTGPIRIRQELIPGRQKLYRWIATFTPQVAALLRKVSPTDCGQFAATSLPNADSVEVVIEQRPRYEQLAQEIQQLHARGASLDAIAVKFQASGHLVSEALKFAQTGERPCRPSRPRSQRNKGGCPRPMRFKEIAPEVVQLIEEEHLKYPEIAARLKVGIKTIQRAYDYQRPEVALQAAETGTRTQRSKFKHLPKKVFDTIRKLAGQNVPVKDIAQQAGCCTNTVRREIERLKTAQQKSEDERQKKSA